jgi:hypothetical protein
MIVIHLRRSSSVLKHGSPANAVTDFKVSGLTANAPTLSLRKGSIPSGGKGLE